WPAVAAVWNRLEAVISRRILAEDMGMFASIQRGLTASENRGVLGACEERIWKFQTWLEAEVSGQGPGVRSQRSADTSHSGHQSTCRDLETPSDLQTSIANLQPCPLTPDP